MEIAPLIIKENKDMYLAYTSLKQKETFKVCIKQNAIFNFSIFVDKNIDQTNIEIDVEEKAKLVGYFADFSKGVEKVKIRINLLGENSSCEWHLASLASNSDKKEFDVSIAHLAKNSYAKMDNYGVCKDDAKLVFSGVCSIEKGCHNSKAHQNAKIMVFDQLSNAVAKPVLKIDENDIEASHAAVVGKISDEHLFYLTSRGLSEEIARELITFGYLKPIINGFKEDLKDKILECIGGK